MKKQAFDLYFKYFDLGKFLDAVIKQGNAIKGLVYRNSIYVQGHTVTVIFMKGC